MKILLVGVGPMGSVWRNVIEQYPTAEAVGYVDLDEGALKRLQEEHGVASSALFTDLATALASTQADVGLIATPPAIHRANAEALLAAGLDVITEKPLAGNWEDALAIAEAARTSGKLMMVAQNYRFRPGCRKVHALLAENIIGDLGYVGVEFHKAADFGPENFRTLMEYPLLIDMSIHHFDLLRYMTGTNVIEVQADSFRPSWSWYKHEPGLVMSMKLSSDLIASYLGCWAAPGDETSWDGRWRFQGERGTLLWNEHGINVQYADGSARKFEPDPMPYTDQAYVLYEFEKARAEGRQPETSVEDNLHSLEIEFMALESINQGGRIRSKLV